MYERFELLFNLLYYSLLIPLGIIVWRILRKKK